MLETKICTQITINPGPNEMNTHVVGSVEDVRKWDFTRFFELFGPSYNTTATIMFKEVNLMTDAN